jgi:hypothetical protein
MELKKFFSKGENLIEMGFLLLLAAYVGKEEQELTV